MPYKNIHIVAFNIPYPPNYGGVIDVFHKLRHLKKLGVKIHLHCFLYNREKSDELLKYCETVSYYKRNTSPFLLFSKKPYIVISRKSDELLANLLKDNYPILFEGLHCCYFLSKKELKNRVKIYRESNIEHDYYLQLCKAERSFFKKIFYYSESLKLKYFEKQVQHADYILPVSQDDAEQLRSRYPDVRNVYLPSFHENDVLKSKAGIGNYILYHGNLSVSENEKAAVYLIEKVWQNSDYKLIVAGLNPSKMLVKLIKNCKNVELVANPDHLTMNKLIEEAQIHILLTFQATGLKLKLLNTLYSGRHVIVNKAMIAGTQLETLCHIAETPNEILEKVKQLINCELTFEDIENRKKVLEQNYDNFKNAEKLISLIFKEKKFK